ncbi:MAG TPA: serine hydrolase domain-containing protein, partial [Thermoanaerobaculia bacterium]|nr:serine hydrolase domain-containing protein [Thermoanaerobaculia bacterium]
MPAAVVTTARQAAEAAMAAGVPAVQIAVSHRGRVIYSEAFGVTDKESATATAPRSVLQIGSVTKQFTAAAILRLAERGALTLDDRIEKHLPEFNPRGATITLRQLLSHTAGVRREWFPPGPPWLDLTAPVTREQTIEGLNKGQLLDSTPGTKWSYSNAGFMLLGLAVESITGMPYADFIRSEFALPLGLIDTGVCGTANLPLPEGYGLPQGTRMAPLHPLVILSSGSLCSTASDLARWAHLLATGYAVLPASYAAMITPTPLANNAVVPYGLGQDVKKMLGRPAVAHGGIVYGFETFLLYFPDEEIAVAVITNAFQ